MLHSKFPIFLLSIFVVLLTSCVTTQKTNYLQKPANQIPSYKDSSLYQDYKLKVENVKWKIKVGKTVCKMQAFVFPTVLFYMNAPTQNGTIYCNVTLGNNMAF